jgi:transcriptional regulator with XRE-family HTH domain
LRAARLAGGLTMSQVAERVGLTRAQVCNVEQGRSSGAERLLAAVDPVAVVEPADTSIDGTDDHVRNQHGGSIYCGIAHQARKELFTAGLRAGFVQRSAVAALVQTYQLDTGMVHTLEESLRMAGIELRADERVG